MNSQNEWTNRGQTDDEVVQFLAADELLEARGVKTLSEYLATETDPRTRAVVDAVLHAVFLKRLRDAGSAVV